MEGLILIAAAAGVVWGAVVFLRGGPLGASLVFLLAATCLSSDFFTMKAGALSVTIDRVLWLVVMGLYLVWRQRGWHEPKPIRAPDVVALLLVGYFALRTLTSEWQTESMTPLVHLVLSYIMPLGIYWVVRQSPMTRQTSGTVLICFALFGVYLAVTCAAEWYRVDWLVYPKYILTTQGNTKLEFIGRGRGPLLNPMVTGILLAACWAAALLWWIHSKRVGWMLALPLSALFALAVCSTMTRSVWMGAALSVAIVGAAFMPKSWRLPVLGGSLLVGIALAGIFWDQIVAFKRDRALTAKETASSVYVRPVLAVLAWNMFEDSPVFGCGFDQYQYKHKFYLADRSTQLVLEKARGNIPHNVLLAVLTETGLVGLTLFVVLLGLWSWDAWRLWRAAAAPIWARQHGLLFFATLGAYLVNGMFHHVAFIPMSNTLLFFMGGVIASLAPQAAAAREKEKAEK